MAHKKSFWHLARLAGAEVLRDKAQTKIFESPLPHYDELQARSQADKMLVKFQQRPNQWIENPYAYFRGIGKLTNRISDLRQRGHVIKCRLVISPAGKDYQYMLEVR